MWFVRFIVDRFCRYLILFSNWHILQNWQQEGINKWLNSSRLWGGRRRKSLGRELISRSWAVRCSWAVRWRQRRVAVSCESVWWHRAVCLVRVRLLISCKFTSSRGRWGINQTNCRMRMCIWWICWLNFYLVLVSRIFLLDQILLRCSLCKNWVRVVIPLACLVNWRRLLVRFLKRRKRCW